MREICRGFASLLLIVLVSISLTSGLKLSASTGSNGHASSTTVTFGATIDDYNNEHIQLNQDGSLSNAFSGTGSLPEDSLTATGPYGTAKVSRSVKGDTSTTWNYDWYTSGYSDPAWVYLAMNVNNAYEIKGDATATNKKDDYANSYISLYSPKPTASLKNYFAYASATNPYAYTYQSFDLAQPSKESNAGYGSVEAVNYAQEGYGPTTYVARTAWDAEDSQLPIKNTAEMQFPASYKLAKIANYEGDAYASSDFAWAATYKGTIYNIDNYQGLTYYAVHTHNYGYNIFNSIQFTDTTDPHGHNIYKQPDWSPYNYVYVNDKTSANQVAFDAKGHGKASRIAQSPSYWFEGPTRNYYASSLSEGLAVDYSNGKSGIGAWQYTDPSYSNSGTWDWGGLTKTSLGWTLPTGSGEHKSGWVQWGDKYKIKTASGSEYVWHLGVDLDGMVGDPVYAIADGEIVNSNSAVGEYGSEGGKGGALIAKFTGYSVDTGSPVSFYALYGHLNKPHELGTVKEGDILGYINDYYAGGYPMNHLHFGVNPDGNYDPNTGYAKDNKPWRGCIPVRYDSKGNVIPFNNEPHYGWINPRTYLSLP